MKNNERGARPPLPTDNVSVSDDEQTNNKSGGARATARSAERAASYQAGYPAGDRRRRPKATFILPLRIVKVVVAVVAVVVQ